MKPSPLSIVLMILCAAALVAAAVLALKLRAQTAGSAAAAEPAVVPRELLPYAALGTNMAENNRIPDLKWTPEQFDAFLAGLRASYEGRGYPFDDDARQLHNRISARVAELLASEQPDPTEEYFRTLRERENVQRTASGLHYRITHEGSGAPPRPGDTIVVSYAARSPDGRTFESLAGVRLRVKTTDLLPGLAEGVQLVKPGGKALFFLPAALSFGDGDWPQGVPRGMPIGFFLELHEVVSD